MHKETTPGGYEPRITRRVFFDRLTVGFARVSLVTLLASEGAARAEENNKIRLDHQKLASTPAATPTPMEMVYADRAQFWQTIHQLTKTASTTSFVAAITLLCLLSLDIDTEPNTNKEKKQLITPNHGHGRTRWQPHIVRLSALHENKRYDGKLRDLERISGL